MSVPTLLAELRRRDIVVTADGETVRCSAPAGALTAVLREQLRDRKAEIVAFLRGAEALARQQRAIVPLQSRGDRVPVFALGGHNGDVFCYRALSSHLGADQPFFGLQPPGVEGDDEPLGSVEALAAYFAAEIRAFRPDGPCVIAGYCAGGTIAVEVARRLVDQGADVRFVALFAGPHPAWYRPLPQLRNRLALLVERVSRHARALASRPAAEWLPYLATARRRRDAERETARVAAADPGVARRTRVGEITLHAVRRHSPGFFAGRVVAFLPSSRWRDSGDALLFRRWRSLATAVEEYCGPDGGRGDRILQEPHVRDLGELFRRSREHSPGERRERVTVPARPVPAGAI